MGLHHCQQIKRADLLELDQYKYVYVGLEYVWAP